METTYILKVSADGRMEREPFDAADALGQLQRAVGGYIERVPISLANGRIDIFVNDEGAINGMPYNSILTRIAMIQSRCGIDRICGDGVFVLHDGRGETVGMDADTARDVERMLEGYGGRVVKSEGGAE